MVARQRHDARVLWVSGYVTARSLSPIITCDAFNEAEAFQTRSLPTVVGSVAASKWMGDAPDAYTALAAGKRDRILDAYYEGEARDFLI